MFLQIGLREFHAFFATLIVLVFVDWLPFIVVNGNGGHLFAWEGYRVIYHFLIITFGVIIYRDVAACHLITVLMVHESSRRNDVIIIDPVTIVTDQLTIRLVPLDILQHVGFAPHKVCTFVVITKFFKLVCVTQFRYRVESICNTFCVLILTIIRHWNNGRCNIVISITRNSALIGITRFAPITTIPFIAVLFNNQVLYYGIEHLVALLRGSISHSMISRLWI